jgi:hypothetical protein
MYGSKDDFRMGQPSLLWPRAATVDQSGTPRVLAHFARSIHALRVNDLRSFPGEVETSPTISRTTANRLSIDNLGEIRSAGKFFPFACRCAVSFHRPVQAEMSWA